MKNILYPALCFLLLASVSCTPPAKEEVRTPLLSQQAISKFLEKRHATLEKQRERVQDVMTLFDAYFTYSMQDNPSDAKKERLSRIGGPLNAIIQQMGSNDIRENMDENLMLLLNSATDEAAFLKDADEAFKHIETVEMEITNLIIMTAEEFDAAGIEVQLNTRNPGLREGNSNPQ